MRFNDIDRVTPVGMRALTAVSGMQMSNEDGLVTQVEEKGESAGVNANLYHGEILKVGLQDDAKNMGINVGDTAIFNSFAGEHIVSKTGFNKLIPLDDIMVTTKDINNITVENSNPAGARLLLNIFHSDTDEDGLFIPQEEALDPNLAAVVYGTVTKVGINCKLGFEEGQIVGFQPYAGEAVKHNPTEGVAEMRVIREEDVILTA